LVAKHCRLIVVVGLCVTASLVGLAQPVAAQSEASAEETVQQAVSLYEDGQIVQARQMLMRVSPDQLSDDLRQQRQQTLEAIQEKLSTEADPAAVLAAADRAAEQRNHVEAEMLYQAVMDHPDSTPQQEQAAATRLTEARRQINVQLDQVRKQTDAAAADINAGRLEAARAKLTAVRRSGVDLGWWDNDRVNRYLAMIHERQGQIADVATALDAPADADMPATADAQPVQADPDDLIARTMKIRAEEAYAQGMEAEQNGDFRLAEQYYESAVQLWPGYEAAQDALADVRDRVGEAAPRPLVAGTVQDRELRRQETVAKFEELYNQAVLDTNATRYAQAQNIAEEAKIILESNRSYLPTEQYHELRARITQLSDDINVARIQAERQEQRVVAEQREEQTTTMKVEAEQRRTEEVNRLIRRAMEFRAAQKYDQALEMVNEAIFFDPTNPALQALKSMIEDSQLLVKSNNAIRRRNISVAEQSLANIRASTPPQSLYEYPEDWPQLTNRRLAQLGEGVGESDANRRTAQKLREPVPVNFDSSPPLASVIEYLRNVTGLNFFVNWAQLEGIGIERDLPITLQLTNVPADQALKLVLQQAEAAVGGIDPIDFSIIEGIVHISTARDLKRATETRVYDIRDLLVRVPNFAESPEFDLGEALQSEDIGGGGGGGGDTTLFGDTDDTDDGDEEAAELTNDIIELIRNTVGRPDEWVAFGGDISSLRELNGNLIVKTTATNHGDILDLLGQLRETRAIQIHIEARFLLVDQNFLEEVGVDLDFAFDNSGPGLGDVGVSQDSFGLTSRESTGLPGGFPTTTSNPFAGGFGVPGGFGSNSRSLDFNISYVDDFQFNLLVRATQANRRSIALTAPRLTLFNGQRAFVFVARQIAFVSDLELVPDTFGFDPTLSFTNSGVVLDVQATVSADRRYVTMTIRPSLATVVQPIRTVPFEAFIDVDGDVGGGGDDDDDDGDSTLVPVSAQLEAPEIELTALNTTVSVPDRGTLVLGGQRLVGEVEVEAGVPVLSKIPILNRLFTNRTTVKDERTLLILVKPTIILQGEEEEKNFPGLQANPADYPANTR